MPEIGFLDSGSKAEFAHLLTAFRHGLKLQGYKVVGSAPKGPKEVHIHGEWANGDHSQLPAKAKSLIDKRVQVLTAAGGIGAALAAQECMSNVGSKVPIVFTSGRATPKPGDVSANAKALHLAMSHPKIHEDHRHMRLRELVGNDAVICQLINEGTPVYDDEGKWPKPVSASNVAELKKAFETAVNVHKAG